jgi:hypothetical protein
MFKLSAFAVLVAQVTSTFAHGGVTSFSIGGTKYQGYVWHCHYVIAIVDEPERVT